MIWLALLLATSLAQDTPVDEIHPDGAPPDDQLDLGGERGQLGIKRRVEPVFPESARRQGLSFGRCVVELEVTASGTPGKPTFVDCPEVFRKSSAEALRQWRWHPELGGDGLPRDAHTRVIIDYRDTSAAAILADPDPLSTPIHEFGTISDPRPECVGAATISATGDVLDKSANRLPACIFEPAGEVEPAKKPVRVLASCTMRFVTDRGYAMKIKTLDCDSTVRAVANRTVRAWTWPWTPDAPVAYEMTLTYLAE